MTSSQGESRSKPIAFRRWVFVAMAVAGLSVAIFWLLLPSFNDVRTPSLRTVCLNNMQNIGVALLNYSNSHQDQLPPAYTVDKNGKPINSWRVLLFRQLDRPDLLATYDYGEPWNGPKNRKFKQDLEYLFGCPSVSATPTGLTNYLVITGPGTLFPGDKSVNLKDVKDGLANTILLVEVADSNVSWMEPRDLPIDEAVQGINATINGKRGKGMSISSHHTGAGAHVMFADGHMRFLSENTSPALLKALITIDGGEDLKALGWD